jgi:hypothetical protein
MTGRNVASDGNCRLLGFSYSRKAQGRHYAVRSTAYWPANGLWAEPSLEVGDKALRDLSSRPYVPRLPQFIESVWARAENSEDRPGY